MLEEAGKQRKNQLSGQYIIDGELKEERKVIGRQYAHSLSWYYCTPLDRVFLCFCGGVNFSLSSSKVQTAVICGRMHVNDVSQQLVGDR